MTVHRPTNGERLVSPVRRALEELGAPDAALRHLDRLVEQIDTLERDVNRYRSAAAAAEVDKQRQVEAAHRRARDCSRHGEDIARWEERALYFDARATEYDQQRIALLSLWQSLEAAANKGARDGGDGGDELVLSRAAVRRALNETRRRYEAARRRADRTIADSRARAEATIRDLQGGHNG